jgi:ubiquinone/menaquinone biosynthesis C-methylase UbiE
MEYIFENTEENAEFERMKSIEDAFDEKTKEFIQNSGIAPGWNCLELGTGAGSILQWMSCLVRERGNVVGIDKNIKFIDSINANNIEKMEGDILEIELESNKFNLIHARYVLIHIAESEQAIKKLIKFLKPGGIIILEEPDFTSARIISERTPHEQAHQKVNESINQMFINLGLNPSFGLKLPAILQKNGIKIERVTGEQHLCCGNSKVAKLMGRSAATLKDKYLQTQKASEQDIQAYINNSVNEKFWAVYYSTISVVGKKLEDFNTIGSATRIATTNRSRYAT